MSLDPGFEPGQHWWEASSLTTALALLAKRKKIFEHNQKLILGLESVKSENCKYVNKPVT